MWKGAVVAQFGLLFWYLPGNIEEDHGKEFNLAVPFFESSFGHGTFRI
jgi:hypothetical protein